MFNAVDYIREVCINRKIPISQLEKDCGFANGYLNPKKLKKIPYDRAKIISKYLNLSLEYLLTGVETETVQPTEKESLTFYDRYLALCKEKNVSPTRAALEMGISKATPTTWKKRGLTPQGETLNKIANYFGVSTDYLLTGLGEKEKMPPAEKESLTFDDFTFAMQNETKDLTDVDKQILLTMAKQLSEAARKRKNGEHI